ncbi:alpha/beta hydrolase [Actinoplanes bogorensis]|uniref:Alpha/beta hydrolase n=1 Tax=Paractinoplanes bogorensis TaxID=1610840 RepID=A0ABS5YPW1_9ACTN|nr:alpha/beta hydrolase [Actinoplanes bogorensis]MBU2665482.1 alpha/beta hydrolase [Actinoplanes bogorensis]
MADAVVVPGGSHGSYAGLLAYAGGVPQFRGATVHRHDWTEAPPAELSESWVCGQVRPVLDRLGGQPLLVGKSLGSFAAGLAAERSLPAVWLTPLLSVPWVPAALERATAPFLLVGGTADKAWDRAAARRLSPYVVEVPAADHGMVVPGPLTDTIAVLARIVVAIDEFLDDIGWP